MNATIVFQKNWDAINEIGEDGKRKYRYIINTGSSRSSKTYSLLQCHYLRALNVPNSRISIWRDTKKDTKDTVLADLKKAIVTFPYHESVTFNKTESIYTFPNGSTIEICGSDDDTKVHGFQGQVLHFNEPYKMSKGTFDQLDMRNTDYVVIDWNPRNRHWIEELSKQGNAIVIHSTFKHNPFVPEEQRKKILSYEPTPFNISQGTADEYMWSVYGLGIKAEKPNKIFKGWKTIPNSEFELAPFNNYFGLDFGSTNPTALVEVKWDGKTGFLVRERMYTPASQLTSSLPDTFKGMKILPKSVIVCDSAQSDSISDLNMNGYLMAIPALKGQGSVNAGINFMQSMQIYYTEDSLNLQAEYDEYEWEVVNGVNLDRPIKLNDHLLDALRYVITYLQFTYHIKH